MSLRRWVSEHDRGYVSLRRAARTAIVMPAMFAIGDKVIGNPVMATFAAFGSFALLLLVDFSGSMRDRLLAQVALAGAGAVLVCLGTLAGRAVWLSTVAMALVSLRRALLGRRELGARRSHDVAPARVHPSDHLRRSVVVDPCPARRLGNGLSSLAGRDRGALASPHP
jgi:hypothetical protein